MHGTLQVACFVPLAACLLVTHRGIARSTRCAQLVHAVSSLQCYCYYLLLQRLLLLLLQ
jgi:hypothetical protein